MGVERGPPYIEAASPVNRSSRGVPSSGPVPAFLPSAHSNLQLQAYLCEGPGPLLHCKLRVAQLAVAGVGRGKPPLQTALVHGTQCASAATWRQQALPIRSLMADPAEGTITRHRDETCEQRSDFLPTTPASLPTGLQAQRCPCAATWQTPSHPSTPSSKCPFLWEA